MIERIPIHETKDRLCDRCGEGIAEGTNWIRIGDQIIALNEPILISGNGGTARPILLCKACSIDFVHFWKEGSNDR